MAMFELYSHLAVARSDMLDMSQRKNNTKLNMWGRANTAYLELQFRAARLGEH